MDTLAQPRYREYRAQVEGELLAPALRNAILIFFLLQTFVFIPADWLLHPDDFAFFLGSRLTMNFLLWVIYSWAALRWPVASVAAVCGLGSLLFMTMVIQTGGVTSGYYVGMILLVVGMGVITPMDARQSAGIGAMMFASYAALPLYTSAAVPWGTFGENLFFLGAACAEACWAAMHMDRMRYADYCQKRALEEARDELAQLDRAKSRFSANVHHELRTPLTLILAPLDALRTGEFGRLPVEVQKTVDMMLSNGRRLHRMINNLLDLAKLENEQFTIQRQPFEIGPMVGELLSSARPLADRKGIELSMEGFDSLPEINADAAAIDKVLVNLLGNALKFTEAQGRVKISARADSAGIKVSVADTGVGIPEAKLSGVFDRFAQVDDSATRRHEGTGIGLALTREMVELHGGRIWAASAGAGQGTTIHFELPLGEPDAGLDEEILRDDRGDTAHLKDSPALLARQSEPASPTRALPDIDRSLLRWADQEEESEGSESRVPALPGASASRGQVLIAEDNPDMRSLLAALVGREFEVRTARNGREALEAVRESPPDLVLSDVMMPEVSGLELCQAIKSDPELRRIPVVLVTSKAERDMKIEGLEIGADDYVTKPFHPRELLARVRSLVRVTSLQRELAHRNGELESTLGELKQAEVQLVQSERLAAVGELAAGLAHEVNNPVNFALNAVRALEVTVRELREFAEGMMSLDASDASELARRLEEFQRDMGGQHAGELAETVLELSGIVGEGLKRTSALVGDLREFARPGSRGETQTDVNVEAGLGSTLTLIGHAIAAADAQLDVQIEPGLPGLAGDPGGLNQVYLNLLKNAVEALGPRGGTIRVRAAREAEYVSIRIGDDGQGIAPEIRERLFEPFFTTKDTAGGTGLGLAICKRIVDDHGGTLTLESEEGRGAEFIVRLPIPEAPE
ncbi:MAG: ATP-binding protein [Myxococcota bacterium]|jgi:signal transduction histidine kinase|nr:ATP-binding protein [Myxococcota bacterium]